MKTNRIFNILVVLALLLAAMPVGNVFATASGTPVVSSGYEPTATLKAAVRYKSFNAGNGGEIYLGLAGLGSRVEKDFYRGTTCDGATPYGAWTGSNHVVFSYDPGTGKITTQATASYDYCLEYNVGNLGALNYIKLDVVNRASGTTVNFNNVKVDGISVGDFTGVGWSTSQVKGLDLSTGFTLEGDLVLAGSQPGGETNKLDISVGYFVPPNQPPTANPGGPYLGAVNTDITFDGTGSSDPDNNTLTYNWDFGDGNIGIGDMPTHSYATPGIYDVCLTVNDGTVDSDPACTIAVVYDPAGGFVTGGGWFLSPEGAYAADPSLTGKATFGFVAKYKKGATIPDGNTEFQFKAGDLNFKSTSYEWLVVAGNKAQFKGEGTINGQGSYKFMIWADDDSPDTFRIQIWGDGTVYDNGSQQALGGGSIVVHK